MNNRGWSLGMMMIFIAALGFCLLSAVALVSKFERITGMQLQKENIIYYEDHTTILPRYK